MKEIERRKRILGNMVGRARSHTLRTQMMKLKVRRLLVFCFLVHGILSILLLIIVRPRKQVCRFSLLQRERASTCSIAMIIVASMVWSHNPKDAASLFRARLSHMVVQMERTILLPRRGGQGVMEWVIFLLRDVCRWFLSSVIYVTLWNSWLSKKAKQLIVLLAKQLTRCLEDFTTRYLFSVLRNVILLFLPLLSHFRFPFLMYRMWCNALG